jgi:cell division protein FtsL
MPGRPPLRGGAVALPAPGGIALGLIGALAGLSRNRRLDRLIRGRGWIALVAFALIGIVAMQLWVVKLNVGIGRALEHQATLQREDSALSIEDSSLSSGERVERLAAAQGMVIASPAALHFETSDGPLDVRLAAAALARPVAAPSASGAAGVQSAAAPTAETESAAPSSSAATAASAASGANEAPNATPTSSATTPASSVGGAAEAPSAASTSVATPTTPVGGAGAAGAAGGAAEAPSATRAGSAEGAQQAPPGG